MMPNAISPNATVTTQVTTSSVVSKSTEPQLSVRLATSSADVIAAQRLRYKVFCEEMGAELHRHDGRDVDMFDDACEHLIVVDDNLDKVVGTYRILPPWGARAVKTMYSENEFRIDSLKPIAHEIFEVGRACIHPAYRSSGALARLWSGLGAYVRDHNVKYLAGCASVPLDSGSLNLGALRAELMAKHLAPLEFRVEPIRGLQSLGDPMGSRPATPPLLKGYLRLGAWVCGEPAWDPDFDSADFLVLLPIERMAPRYAQHFLGARTDQ
jgi:putative hemolysin